MNVAFVNHFHFTPREKGCVKIQTVITCTLSLKKTSFHCFSVFFFPLCISQFDFECRAHGANFLAYPPVVAGGNRSNTLHYINNNQIVKVS